MPGGKSSRDKGGRGERELAKLLGGERVPLSGAQGGSFKGDVIIPYIGTGECKWRKNGFVQLYNWLDEKDFLALRADRHEWLIVMRAKDLKLLLDEIDELKRGAK